MKDKEARERLEGLEQRLYGVTVGDCPKCGHPTMFRLPITTQTSSDFWYSITGERHNTICLGCGTEFYIERKDVYTEVKKEEK